MEKILNCAEKMRMGSRKFAHIINHFVMVFLFVSGGNATFAAEIKYFNRLNKSTTMKKSLLFLAAMAATMEISADEWVRPTFSGAFQPLTVGDTVYIYNPEAKLFLTEGNEWGTHATLGAQGLRFCVQQYVPAEGEWDSKTYCIYDESVKKGGWYKMFITDGGHVYVDNGSQEDNMWQFQDLGDGTYHFLGADTNPVWTASGDMEGYMMGCFTGYVNTDDGIETGTGVIYDYYGLDHSYADGTFQATWAFVSQADYAAYGEQVATYEAAVALGKQIADAEEMGVTGLDDEKAVYVNTGSSLEEIQAASASAEKKVLAFYEVNVTPDTPVNILTDDCSKLDGWINGVGASTFEIGTWAGDNWEGFVNGDPYINIWDANLCGAIYREREGLPNGIYVVTISAQAQNAAGAVFANENQKAVPADNCGHIYKITTEVTDGTLQFGYVQEVAATNWVTLDNVSVDYFGCGVEAYRFWLNGLLESAPSFDDETVMDSLITEYQEVLASVETAETKEEILAIIPAYEAILNEIHINMAAYSKLIETTNAAEEMGSAEGINEHYGALLGDYVSEVADPIIDEAVLGTEAVNKATADLQNLMDEAQNYIWKSADLQAELVVADSLYQHYKDSCAVEAADAYLSWVDAFQKFDFAQATYSQVLTLLDELYAIEFNLAVPVEPASDENPVDYTAKIQYPSFDNGATGWVNDGWSTCGKNDWNSFADGVVIDVLYLNLWNPSNARVYQTLTGLPAGKYTMQISAFADAEGFQVYANEDYLDVKVGQNEEGAPSVFSNVAETEAFDGRVWYGNIYQVTTIVGEDGTMELGARNVGNGTVWGMIDNVKLLYKGKVAAEIISVEDITNLIDRYLNSEAGITVGDITDLIDKYLAQ